MLTFILFILNESCLNEQNFSRAGTELAVNQSFNNQVLLLHLK